MSQGVPVFVDTHAHLDMAPFDVDRSEVIKRAVAVGVSTIICVGTDLKSSEKAIKLAEAYPELLAAVGVHPHDAGSMREADVAQLEALSRHPKVVGIGEIGLDYYRNRSPREAQLRALKWQLELAERMDLPVVVHCRQAEKDMLPVLQDWSTASKRSNARLKGVIHCFSGDTQTAEKYLDMGFLISLGAYIGYPSSTSHHDTIKNIPLEKLMLETDSPFLPPQDQRGQRNEPSYLLAAAKIVALVKQVPLEMVAEKTTQNAHHLFQSA